MKVKLINYSNNPENMVACAAKLCYSASNIDDILEKTDDKNAGEFVDMLAKMGHESPMEHAFFTFAIEGVSRSLLAQITRHRIASFSVQSQRYVNGKNFSFVVPPEIENDEKIKEIFLDAVEKDLECYNKIAKMLKNKHRDKFLKQGVDEELAERRAEKMGFEDARFVLPNACSTKMMLTMNARSLLNFFRLRCCNRAQWEINQLACEILSLVSKVAPSIFKNAGPPCVGGACSEGRMSCKKASEVREKIEKIKGKRQDI